METCETQIIREALLPAAGKSVDEGELHRFVVEVHEVLSDIGRENDPMDQQIVDLHFHQTMRFAQIATELGITESAAHGRWYRLLVRVADRLQERLRGDAELAFFRSLMIERPDAFLITASTLLATQKLGSEPASTAAKVLRRTVQTFGNHSDAVRWLLDECPALGGRPIDLLIDANGVRDVENVLGCVDHGLIF